MPLGINIGLYAAFFIYGSGYLNSAVVERTAQLALHWPVWLATLVVFIAKAVAWIALGLVAAISFTVVSGLTCAPFNDALSRAAYQNAMRKKAPDLPMIQPLAVSVLQTMKLEFKRMTILIGGGLVAIGLGFIPFLQIPALLLGSFLVAFEYFGYPLSQRTHELKPVLKFTLHNFGLSLGFGGFLLLLMAVPFASMLYIPLAVVASSELFAQLEISARKNT